jgi:hypothetical protein
VQCDKPLYPGQPRDRSRLPCSQMVTRLGRSKPAEVAEIEKQGTPLHEIHVKPGIVEGIVDQRRIEVTRHDAAYTD